MERYPLDRNAMQEPIRRIAQAAQQADAIFIPDGADSVVTAVQGFTAGGLKKRVQLIGTGLWDDPRIFAEQGAQGAWFAAPDPAGFRAFSGRYRSRYGGGPVPAPPPAHYAAWLSAALAKTPGPPRVLRKTL